MGVDLLTPTHLIFLGLLALVLFGPKRLPEMGRSLGNGIREFKESMTTTTAAVSSEPIDNSAPTPTPTPGSES